MHEISLVQGLFEQLAELAKQNRMTRIISVTMDIGPLSGVVEDSFRFGFEILSSENDLVRGAQLIINTTAVAYRCSNCEQIQQHPTSVKPDSCPKCGEEILFAEGGDELILQKVEME
ncbi:MAG: hydrogenase maturation nickel metallochaperone HypA [Desulfopila sp.]|jgi:hydrogenase nickel insertion protein HypA|nr:hydrogenase maturation nickel metallochaperone HypA [Desulfopila sp.]